MKAADLLDVPPAAAHAAYLAEVTSVSDPDALGRVQVRLLNYDGVADQDAAVWARVAVPFAGDRRGALFVPDVGDEVLVTLLGGDPRYPVVLGGLWNGRNAPPDRFPSDRVDRWLFVGRNGTRVAIVEAADGQEVIELHTPGGQKVDVTSASGGSVTLDLGTGTSLTLDAAGVTVQTAAKVSVQASTVQVDAGQVTVNAAMSRFSGVVQGDTLIATTVVATTYTPGAGNIW